MTEEQKLRERIRRRLRSAPRYPAYCGICGRHAATYTFPIASVVHHECYEALQKSRQKPT